MSKLEDLLYSADIDDEESLRQLGRELVRHGYIHATSGLLNVRDELTLLCDWELSITPTSMKPEVLESIFNFSFPTRPMMDWEEYRLQNRIEEQSREEQFIRWNNEWNRVVGLITEWNLSTHIVTIPTGTVMTVSSMYIRNAVGAASTVSFYVKIPGKKRFHMVRVPLENVETMVYNKRRPEKEIKIKIKETSL